MIIAHDSSSPKCGHPSSASAANTFGVATKSQFRTAATISKYSNQLSRCYRSGFRGTQRICREAIFQGTFCRSFHLGPRWHFHIFRCGDAQINSMGEFCLAIAALGFVVLNTQNAVKDNVGIPNVNVEDGHVGNCVPWTRESAPEHRRLSRTASGAWSQARLNLPTDADALYLLARGARMSGELYVSESPEANHVSVTVFVYHRDEGTLSRGTICRLSRGDGQMGVGIFVCRLYMLCYFQGIDMSSCSHHFHVVCLGTLEEVAYISSSTWGFPPVMAQFGIYRLSMRTYPCSPWTWVTYRPSASATLL